MAFKTKDWLGLGLGAAAIGGAYDWDKGLSGITTGDNWGTSNYGSNLGFGDSDINTSGGDVTQYPSVFNSTEGNALASQAYKADTDPSYLGGFGDSVGNFLGSKAGSNVLQYGTPLVSGILGSRATDRAAALSADTADKDREAYLSSLATDQARIDEDQRRRDEAAAAMSSGFNSGLGRV